MLIAQQVYKISADFPQTEIYGLTSQLRRAGVSVPSNIAEGFGRSTTKSYVSFVKVARGSLYGLETQLILAEKLDFIRDSKVLSDLLQNIDEEGRMINSFIKKLEEKYTQPDTNA